MRTTPRDSEFAGRPPRRPRPSRLGPALLALAMLGAIPATGWARRGAATLDPAAVRAALQSHTLRSLDGARLPWGALAGEVVVVNFWASWCPPCRRELPALDALNDELSKQGGRVLAVSIDGDPGNARRFARAQKLRLPIYADGPRGLARQLDLDHVPFTLVLSRAGDVVYTSAGADGPALDALRAKVRQLVAARPLVARDNEGATP